MSDMETRIGTLREIKFPEGVCTFADKVNLLEAQIDDNGDSVYKIENVDYDDEYIYCKNIVYIKGKFYRIIDEDRFATGDYIGIGNREENGNIFYVAQWYNGGACFDEVVESILEDLGEI